MANAQNQLMLLSDCLEKIRVLVNDKDVNNFIQDKKFLELAQKMAETSRNANTCAGVFFDMYMSNRPKETTQPTIDLSGIDQDATLERTDNDPS